MTQPTHTFSGLEIIIFAVQVWAAFFLTTALAHIVLSNLRAAQLFVLFAGTVAIVLIAVRSFRSASSRRYWANFFLLGVGLFIAFDMLEVLSDI